ncbi:uncharacterized protein LOC115875653 [Sitophilus oryzae]|uniref:Uncharacterized protein LOC115875653 n=1 Tax=Sitophilus oryzae TaxID=7048 RepID=A0A6J2X7R7_SITOR|nr:uncharacterized protein LOC115875653 [Sitophilus oryzae]
MAKLYELRYELVPHPPYSPDLAPSDYYLFPDFKKWLRQRPILRTWKGIEKLENRWTKCIELNGDYVEKNISNLIQHYLHFFSYIGLLCDDNASRYVGGTLMVVGLSTVPFFIKFMHTFEELGGITFLFPLGLFVMAFEIFNAGQGIEDQFEEIYTALFNVRWYWWNNQNKKSYVMIISMLQQVKSLYIGINSKVNRRGFLRVN